MKITKQYNRLMTDVKKIANTKWQTYMELFWKLKTTCNHAEFQQVLDDLVSAGILTSKPPKGKLDSYEYRLQAQ